MTNRGSWLRRLCRRPIFGDHPYGRPVRGRVETLEALDSGKLRKFWERSYEADSSFLVAAGDVDPEAFVAVVERSFGAWAAGGGQERPW